MYTSKIRGIQVFSNYIWMFISILIRVLSFRLQVYLLPDKSKTGKRKTKVKKNTLSPVFEETLSFVQPLAALSARTLWLSVWHADIFGRNDFLGEVTLPLADVVFDDPAPTWYKLHERVSTRTA